MVNIAHILEKVTISLPLRNSDGEPPAIKPTDPKEWQRDEYPERNYRQRSNPHDREPVLNG
jgi:hypothetical protein